MRKKGVLLVNLGTPDSPSVADVRKYLNEFLMDERVIDINPINRTLLVKGIIVPFRGPKSAKIYKEVWTENGSPLLYFSVRAKELLQERMGKEYIVELAMRYQSPSIERALKSLQDQQVEEIRVVPLFPQYASASTGSVIQKVMKLVSQWQTIPNISFVNSFHDNEGMLNVFAENALKYQPESFDHILFSFHGLPERQLSKADHSEKYCLQVPNCCDRFNEVNRFCYSAQCHHTARLLAEKLNIPKERYTICFQSRLGNSPWKKPYTIEVLEELAKKGAKRLLVLSPAFVADCLETNYEIAREYNEEFQKWGGEKIQLVESLNDNPKWIEALEGIVKG